MVVEGAHPEDALAPGEAKAGDLNDVRQSLQDEDDADDGQQQPVARHEGCHCQGGAQG